MIERARLKFLRRFGILPHAKMCAGLRRTWHYILCIELGQRPSSRVPKQY